MSTGHKADLVKDLTQKTMQEVPKDYKAKFGVLTLFVIETVMGGILSGVVQHYVDKCYEKDKAAFHKPSLRSQMELRWVVARETRRVRRERGGRDWPAYDFEGNARTALYAMAAKLDDGDLHRVRMAQGAV